MQFVLLIRSFLLQGVCTPKSCKSSLESIRPVCGSDGFTYPNRCLLELSRCRNSDIVQSHRGVCQNQTSCSDYLKNISSGTAFKPECSADGNFAATQCDSLLGYCWCVSVKGIPLPYTLVQYSPNVGPSCTDDVTKKSSPRRRSPSRLRKRGGACKREDKAKFNNNLIKIFQTEWARESGQAGANLDEVYGQVLEWKFKNMDENSDGRLDKSEYRELRKIVKKAVKPKRCAKSFAKACDMNRDQIISREEWSECLTRDGTDGMSLGFNILHEISSLEDLRLCNTRHGDSNFVFDLETSMFFSCSRIQTLFSDV